MIEQHLEIAAFGISEADSFASVQLRLHEELTRFDGCEYSIPLRSISDQSMFADIILWDSEGSAERAAQNLQPGGPWDWYSAPAADLRLFTHFKVGAPDVRSALTAIRQAVVEVVVLKPSDPLSFESAHSKLHDQYFETMDSIVGHTRLGPNAELLVGDINGWTSPEGPELAFEKFQANEDIAPMFSEENEVKLFASFRMTQG